MVVDVDVFDGVRIFAVICIYIVNKNSQETTIVIKRPAAATTNVVYDKRMQLNFGWDRISHLIWLIVISVVVTTALNYFFDTSMTISMGIAVTLTVQINNLLNGVSDTTPEKCTDSEASKTREKISRKKGKRKQSTSNY